MGSRRSATLRNNVTIKNVELEKNIDQQQIDMILLLRRLKSLSLYVAKVRRNDDCVAPIYPRENTGVES